MGGPHPRHDRFDEPARGVHVRWMREAGDEQDVAALRERGFGAERGVGVRRHRARIDGRLQRTDRIGFVGRWIQHRIHAAPDRALARFHRCRLALQRIAVRAAIQQRGLVLHAAEMQVVPVIDDTRAAVGADRGQVVLGHVGPRQQHRVEDVAAGLDQRADPAQPARAVQHLDAHRLQPRRVLRVVMQVVRPEFHHAARLQQPLQEGEHGARTGIAIRLGDVVVDHQHHRPVPGAVARARDLLAVRIVRGQLLRPAFAEPGLVGDLAGLDPAAGVGAVRDALKVHHLRERGEVHLPARFAYPEREVRILAVGGDVALVETAEFAEQCRRQQQRRARAVIRAAHVVEFGRGGVAQPAIVPRRGIAPQDAAGFLQAPVRIQQHRAGHAGVGVLREHVEQRVQPARHRLGVVVEEADVLATRELQGLVAGTQEAEVLRILVVAQPGDVAQRGHPGIAGGVLQHQYFERRGIATGLQRAQATRGVIELAVGRHHDGHARRGHVREMHAFQQGRHVHLRRNGRCGYRRVRRQRGTLRQLQGFAGAAQARAQRAQRTREFPTGGCQQCARCVL